MKKDCEHENAVLLIGTEFMGKRTFIANCPDCAIVFEYACDTNELFQKIKEIDPDPNIFINGVLQND